MATQYSESFSSDSIVLEINQSIDRLILSLEQRRLQLLNTLRKMCDTIIGSQVAEEQLVEIRTTLETKVKHNLLYSMQTRLINEIKAKRATLPTQQKLRFDCDTLNLEKQIARLGDITQFCVTPIQEIPDYSAFQQPNVAVAVQGSGPGELNWPRGISVSQQSEHIYVADSDNNRIQIFSEKGDHLTQFGDRHLKKPHGILIHQNSIFVTDTSRHAILVFELPSLKMLERVGHKGSGNDEFHQPCQVAISPSELLYVADEYNDRLQILNTNLAFKGSLRHSTMTQPVDVKFTQSEMFVLSFSDNPCLHVFTLSGEKSRSIVTRGTVGMQVEGAFFFCLDGHDNIVISDSIAHSIKVFSKVGNLLHTIGQQGQPTGMLYYPRGIAILNKNKLICVSSKDKFGLLIFSN